MNTPQTLKGFRDFLPADMAVRNFVKKTFIEAFEQFGFQPLETPTLEYASTLMGKYGDEADKLVYTFTDRGDRQVGMRYDLTVPQSKVLSIYRNAIPSPFKAYQIQPVWRADNTQKGRYREFIQCEANTYGSPSPLADAEIIYLIAVILKKLKFQKFRILINSRSILINLLETVGIEKSLYNSVLVSLDKFDKIGQEGVTNELTNKGIKQSQIDALFKYIKSAQPDENLTRIFQSLISLGLEKEYFQFTPTLVRGLDYYTSTIFEAVVDEPKIGSLCGGGRFDNLINSLGGPDTPAVGFAFGFERIVDCINELNLFPNLPKTATQVLVANFSEETLPQCLQLIGTLQTANINTLLYPDTDKLGKQFKYADFIGIPYVAIIGTDEAAKNQVTIKNLKTGEQTTIPQNQITTIIK